MNRIKIPRRGDAKVAFFGVEIDKAYPFIAGSMMGVIAGMNFDMGFMFYLGIPYLGYLANKLVIEWQSQNLPGAVRTKLFALGIRGFNSTFDSQRTIFVGDSQILQSSRRLPIEAGRNLPWN